MQEEIKNYLEKLTEDRKAVFLELRNTIVDHLPEGFTETLTYGMVSFVVPHSIYPAGYHCDPKQPLPFISIASQKNHISLYHMGLYADENLLAWFQQAYTKQTTDKLDMGKGCVRFKKIEKIPMDLIALLVSKISVEDWITCYESKLKK